MSLTTKEIFYQSLYIACISVVFLNIYELTFAVWSLTAVVTIGSKYSMTLLKYCACFAVILLTALIVSFFRDESMYRFFRDVAYLLKPIIGLVAGYQLCKKNKERFLSVLLSAGIFIAVIHLLIIFITFLRFNTITVNLLRNYCGYFSDYEIYVLLILIFHKKFELNYSKKKLTILISIMALSSFLYLSRTNIIQLVILYIAMKGYLKLNAKSIAVGLTAIAIVGLSYTAIYMSNPQRSGKGLQSFLYKIKNAPIEPFKTKVDKENWKDFNDNYRSYENILTVKQVTGYGTSATLFGKGLGSSVNLGRMIWTNDGEFIQFIPILHNGFATVFLKSGVFGVFFLVLSIFLLGRQKHSNIPMVQNINQLFIGTSIFLIVSYWVFMGLYLKLDNKSILLGFLLCYKEILIKQSRIAPTVIEEI